MGAFARQLAAVGTPATPGGPAKARRTITLEPSAFSDEWELKPPGAVVVGLRLLGEDVPETARAEASKRAWQLHPRDEDEESRIDCFNNALQRWILARATCKPEDISKPFFPAAEDTVLVALTTEGVRLLWEALEWLTIEDSPLSAEAMEFELQALCELMQKPEAWALLQPAEARRVRRLLRDCLERLCGGDVVVEASGK